VPHDVGKKELNMSTALPGLADTLPCAGYGALSMDANAQESARLDALRSLNIWDVPTTPELDRITALVAEAFDMPTVLVSFVGREAQRFVSSVGIDVSGTEREASICSVAIEQDDVFVVEDLSKDARFVHNRLVRDHPGFRFYAGVPLVTSSGHAVGTLCALDVVPRRFDAAARRRLASFAALVLDQIALRQMVGRRDPVTGLLNRQQFYVDMAAITARGFAGQRQLAMVDVMDLPLAHQLAQAVGLGPVEAVIRQVALRLSDIVRPHAELYHVTVARFAFLVPALDADAVAALLETVTAEVARPLLAEGVPLQPSCHGGLVTFDEADAPDALRRAVAATQDAIDARSTWCTYDAAKDQRMRRQYRLAADAAVGLERDEFRLVYQPRVDMESGLFFGGEALVRWRHPELGDVSPGEFIPIMARTATMRALTDWVVEHACRQLAAWMASGLELTLSVNVTAADFADGGLPERVLACCTRHGVPPSRLEVEITEGEWLEGSEAVCEQLARLRTSGVRVAIDDFGVGYSNFSYLYTLPFDTLKLDQSLIRGFLHNDRQLAMLRGIVRLCGQLGLEAVAEGVETDEEHTGLLAIGCVRAQGFLYATPLAAADFAAAAAHVVLTR
jgi:EAL domain-containing protein (putative c-di-GMP-specific phosphodiesterase class I)/GGDEF domain-containing protein